MKTILVTGASVGFGHAIAGRFLADGARVIACARRLEPLQELAQRHAGRVLPIQLDVTDSGAVARVLADLPGDYAAIDVLVNNAGLALGIAPAQEASLDEWDRMISTNCAGAIPSASPALLTSTSMAA